MLIAMRMDSKELMMISVKSSGMRKAFFVKISIVTWANYDVHPTMYAVGVNISIGENGERGLFFDAMTVNRFMSSFDEFIEFVGKSNKLKQMYKEFFRK